MRAARVINRRKIMRPIRVSLILVMLLQMAYTGFSPTIPAAAANITGLVNSWPGEGDALDQAGTSNGTLFGGANFETGRIGQAFNFDGVNDYVDFGSSVAAFGTNAFSFSFWIKTTSRSLSGVLGKRASCGHGNFIDIRMVAGGRLQLELDSSGGTNYNNFLSTRAINNGQYHHVAIVRQGPTATIYIDNTLDSSHSTAGTTNVGTFPTPFRVGRSACTGALDGTGWFAGQIDQLQIYNRALSATDVMAAYYESDTTAPTITGSRAPAANDNGWNNGPVTASFTCTDEIGGSGLRDCSAPTTLATNGAGQSVIGSAHDKAGNTTTATVSDINIDQSAPTLTGAPTTPPNAAGWYRGNVTIRWTCADSLSGIAGGCPGDSTITGEGQSLSTSTSVSDLAGNTTTTTSPPVKIDRTQPVTVPSAPGGWNNQSVTVGLAANDNLSGVAATFYRLDGGVLQSGASVSISTNGSHTLAFHSVDAAGNVEATKIIQVLIDKTPPTINHSLSPAPNGNGWNKGPVTVTFTCGDTLSGLQSCAGASAGGARSRLTLLTVSTQGANQPVPNPGPAQAVDMAGNHTSDPASVNIDTTAPQIAANRAPAANPNGWNNTPVTVTFNCHDNLSGIANCSPPRVLGEGTNQTANGAALDAADNSASTQVSGINVDMTAPTITGAAVLAPVNGWYRGPVTVHFTCSDDRSGIVTGGCPADVILNQDGPGQSVVGIATDRAGNTAMYQVSGINIDQTPPTITAHVTSNPNAAGWYNGPVTVQFTCGDVLSGVPAGGCPDDYTFTGDAANQTTTGIVEDAAGNSASVTVDNISIDQSAPMLSGAPATPPNAAGWYKGDVVVHWTCADQVGLSGLAGNCPAGTLITGEGSSLTSQAAVSDRADNSTTATISPAVRIDRTPPLTTADAPSAWTNQGVVVNLSANDNLSGVADTFYTLNAGPQQIGTSLQLSEEGTYTIAFHSVDAAGNVEPSRTVQVLIDRNAPAINHSLSPAANDNGWNNSAVAVTFTCVDNTSGIQSCVGSPGGGQHSVQSTLTVSTEGANQPVPNPGPAQAVDVAGNRANDPASVNIDTTAPQITANRAPAANPNGWNNTLVTVSYQCADTLSGVGANGCPSSQNVGHGGDQVASGTATDNAGNTAVAAVHHINIDLNPPVVTGATTTQPNSNGWYKGDVTVRWTCTDDLSGIGAGSCPDDYTFTGEGANLGTSVSVDDLAGNTGTGSVTGIYIDTTPPTINGSAITQPNGNGWYKGPVTIHFTCADAGSGIAEGGCPGDYTFSANGPNQSVSRTVTDKAGNSASVTIDHINIDQAAPSLSGAPAIQPNAAGWYSGNVTVHWTCADQAGLSGIDGNCPAGSTVSGEGSNLTAHSSVSDLAGNTTSSTSPGLNIDQTEPETRAEAPGGWNNSSVTVHLNATDNLSGIAATHFALDGGTPQTGTSVAITTQGVHTLAFWSEDHAGNVEAAKTIQVNLDLLAPNISHTQSPAAVNGWNRGPVTVTFNCSAQSGIQSCAGADGNGQSSVQTSLTVNTEGANQPVPNPGPARAISVAGNHADDPVSVNIDLTAPTISASRAPAANANGWNNVPVTVTYTCSDALSGVHNCNGAQSFNEGINQEASGSATDNAGNTASATLTGINVDTTPPTITGAPATQPNARGWYNGPVTIHFTCDDALSGVQAGGCPGDYIFTANGADQSVTHTVTDRAGNSASFTVSGINIDMTAPTISTSGTPGRLWAPNHQYVTLSTASFVQAAQDNLDGDVNASGVTITRATSDEPETSPGSGNTLNDIVIAADGRSVQLRAEREGKGNGRVYTISVRVADRAGNVGTAAYKVYVPHGRWDTPVEDAPQYAVTRP